MRLRFQRLMALALAALLAFPFAPPAFASAYDAHPRLVVLIVIDQFREDYLERYRADLKAPRGFRLFLDHGAYFPDCYYDYANTKTAPGHATLGTGAYTDGHGIAGNEWWDLARNQKRPISSVEDERYRTVGLLNAREGAVGASPRNELASTVGDELRLGTGGLSRVYGISLKDRAAILPAGHAANGAFWIDPESGSFITSTYYMNALPDWAAAFNASDRAQRALDAAGATGTGNFYDLVGPTPAANAYELDFARALISGEQLGRHATTDMLTISLSANDILGHRVGPDAPEERQMVAALDTELDGFFSWLDLHVEGGLANVWIALSADHGVAPAPVEAAALGMPAAAWDMKKFTATLNDAMNAKFSPGEKVEYLLPQQELPYIALNRPAFERAGINEQEAEEAVQSAVPEAVASLPAQPRIEPLIAPALPVTAPLPPAGTRNRRTRTTTGAGANRRAAPVKVPVATPEPASPQPLQPPSSKLPPTAKSVETYTRVLLASGQLPPDEFGRLIAHSISANGGWWVMVIPESFQMGGGGGMGGGAGRGTTHFSPWSYDRHVPLGLYGTPFVPGVYYGRVEPVDLAATWAALLGLNQPSASVGRILTEALRTPAEETAARAAASHKGRPGKRGAQTQTGAEGLGPNAISPEPPLPTLPQPQAPGATTPSTAPPSTPPATPPGAAPQTAPTTPFGPPPLTQPPPSAAPSAPPPAKPQTGPSAQPTAPPTGGDAAP